MSRRLVLILVVVAIAGAGIAVAPATEWLWFHEVRYTEVFLVMVVLRVSLGLAVAALGRAPA